MIEKRREKAYLLTPSASCLLPLLLFEVSGRLLEIVRKKNRGFGVRQMMSPLAQEKRSDFRRYQFKQKRGLAGRSERNR